MINSEGEIHIIVMICDGLGIIDEIAFPKDFVSQYFEVGENFLLHVDPDNFSKALSFTQQLNNQKYASNYELNFTVEDVINTIFLSGFSKDNQYMIIANTHIEALSHLNEELMKINNEQINVFRNTLLETIRTQELQTKKSYDHFDEISKLNNELLNSQRELAHKNQQLNILNSELERMATRDSLTGLYNRRLLVEKFDEEKRRSTRLNYPVSMVVIDINHFKNVNDQFGHSEGDVLLIKLSSLIMKMTRDSLDLAFRIGGDEFLLLLTNCDKKNAEIALQRLNNEFKTYSEIASLAYGIIEIDANNESDLDRCMMKADQLMFENKQGSR